MSHGFDCPKCSYETEYTTPRRGAIGVFLHFSLRHGWYSFRVGCPLIDEEPPEDWP